MVDAAPRAVPERVLAERPGAPHHLFLPGLVDAQVGGVDEATQDQVSEVLAEVVKGHPEKTTAEEQEEDGEGRTPPQARGAADLRPLLWT